MNDKTRGVMFSSKKKNYETPRELFDKLNDEFHFTVDLCADEYNHLCEKYYSAENDGLKANLDGEIVFCNPPYGHSSTSKWIQKCATDGGDITVMLIPARTDTKAFHEYIWGKAEIRFLQGRIKFGGGAADRAPFPSMVVIFRKCEV